MADLDSIDRALSYAWPYRLLKSAVTAPRDAYTGKLPMQSVDRETGEVRTSDEAIQRANDLAAMAISGTSFKVPKGSQPLYGDVLSRTRDEIASSPSRRNSMYRNEMLEPEDYSIPRPSRNSKISSHPWDDPAVWENNLKEEQALWENILNKEPIPEPTNSRQISSDPLDNSALFGKRTEPDPRLVAGDEGFGSNAANLGKNQAMLRQAEQDFIRDQLARIEGEGGPTADAIKAAKDLHNNRIAKEQALKEAEVNRFEDDGGGMAHASVPPVFTRNFTMGETVPMTHGILQGKPYYGPLATRSSTDMVGTLGPEITPEIAAALNAAKGAGNSNLPLLAALGLVSFGGGYGLSQLYRGQPGAAVPPSGGQAPLGTTAAAPAQQQNVTPQTAVNYKNFSDEDGGANYRGPVATPGAQLSPIQAAITAIANRQEAPKAQERTIIDWGDPDRASDFFRASKQMQEAINAGKDVGYYGQKEKRGGSVEKKPDSVHKALEIIHHLITR